jgi:hypothetical protein
MKTTIKDIATTDSELVASGAWRVTCDGIQWIMQRRKGIDKRTGQEVWAHVSFVSSTKAILARCMREKGVPVEDAQGLLAGLAEAFGAYGGCPARGDPEKSLPTAPTRVVAGKISGEALRCASLPLDSATVKRLETANRLPAGQAGAQHSCPEALPQNLVPSTAAYLAKLAEVATGVESPHLADAPPIVPAPAAELDDIPVFLQRS